MSVVEVAQGSPLADALQNAIQPKLVELGWSTGGLDDSALAEYIVLMLVNGKTQHEIATEVAQDLLGLSAEESNNAVAFSQWLFEQIITLSGRNVVLAGTMAPEVENAASMTASGTVPAESPGVDEDMGDIENTGTTAQDESAIPTGPKSMRVPGNQRMLGQLNKAMNRKSDAPLRKIKGAAGTGRINSHAGREPPKGPTPKGPRSQVARSIQTNQPSNQSAHEMAMAMQMAQNNPLTFMTPEQQMQIMAMYEQQAREQARLMAQILAPQNGNMHSAQMGMPGGAFPPVPQQAGKSLFDRVNAPGNFNKRQYNNGQSSLKANTASFEPGTTFNAEPASSMEVEPSSQPSTKPDPATTMCHFNLSCTNPTCYFVHQSPAAPPGTTIDMTDTCSFGPACKNRKCVGKHPSPSKLGPLRSVEDCKFYPNCTNPSCPFRHPSTAPCRNGADCTVPNCTFSHNKTECKFNPCLNPACVFKHAEGQKRGKFQDMVWVNKVNGEEEDKAEHVSNRKFMEDDLEEDLVRPGGGESLEVV